MFMFWCASTVQARLDSLYLPHTAVLAEVRLRLSEAQAEAVLEAVAQGESAPSEEALVAAQTTALATARLAHSTLRFVAAPDPFVRARMLWRVGRLRRQLLPSAIAATGKPQFKLPLGTLRQEADDNLLSATHPFRLAQRSLELALVSFAACVRVVLRRYHSHVV